MTTMAMNQCYEYFSGDFEAENAMYCLGHEFKGIGYGH